MEQLGFIAIKGSEGQIHYEVVVVFYRVSSKNFQINVNYTMKLHTDLHLYWVCIDAWVNRILKQHVCHVQTNNVSIGRNVILHLKPSMFSLSSLPFSLSLFSSSYSLMRQQIDSWITEPVCNPLISPFNIITPWMEECFCFLWPLPIQSKWNKHCK